MFITADQLRRSAQALMAPLRSLLSWFPLLPIGYGSRPALCHLCLLAMLRGMDHPFGRLSSCRCGGCAQRLAAISRRHVPRVHGFGHDGYLRQVVTAYAGYTEVYTRLP